ncbi:MAG: copper amine oxidase N-terminal domain-containing protein [Clostridiales bacterium]
MGKKTAHVNGQAVTMEVAPVVISDRTMVPLRFIAEAFGAEVGYSGNKDQIITIRLRG